MKIRLAAIPLLAALLSTAPVASAAAPVRYILDTDIASDCDDAGAVAMVNALIDNGEVNVLAMMVSTGGPSGVPCLSAINTWYGHKDIPIGTVKNPKFWVGGGKDKPAGAFNYESYNRIIAETYPTQIKSGEDAPDAKMLYRKILAAQPDHSVVIETIGPLINMRHLMETPADEHSKLNGMELIRAKVKKLVITGGRNPAGTSSNFSKEDAEIYTKPVIDEWPTPVVFVGNDVGGELLASWKRNAEATEGNPARVAYKIFHKKDFASRASSDQAGVLYTIRGLGDVFTLVEEGHQICDKDGNTKWVAEKVEGKNHAYVKKIPGSDKKILDAIESLMTQSRKTPASTSAPAK